MKKRPIESVKAEINLKRTSDKKKIKVLTKLAISGLATRLLIYSLSLNIRGLWIEILWIPLLMLVFALPFYGFESLLDRVKKNKDNR